jgi:hypothetical protein
MKKGFFNRLGRKWYRFKKSKLFKKYVFNKDEENTLLIIKKLLKNPEIKLYLDPITLERYLTYKKGEINVVISPEDGIIIGNHQYEYRVYVNQEVYKEIVSKFDRFLHHKVVRVEKEIALNRVSSLEKIANSL